MGKGRKMMRGGGRTVCAAILIVIGLLAPPLAHRPVNSFLPRSEHKTRPSPSVSARKCAEREWHARRFVSEARREARAATEQVGVQETKALLRERDEFPNRRQ